MAGNSIRVFMTLAWNTERGSLCTAIGLESKPQPVGSVTQALTLMNSAIYTWNHLEAAMWSLSLNRSTA